VRQGKCAPSGIRPFQPTPDATTTSAPPQTPPGRRGMTSVCGGHRLSGAPRRNRTGDPILTMEPPGTAVRTAVLAGNARPSGSKLSVLLRPSYAFTSRQTLRCRGQAIVPVEVTTSVSASVWERGVAAAIRQGSEPGGDPPKPPGTASPGTSTARGVRNPPPRAHGETGAAVPGFAERTLFPGGCPVLSS
jgi:hypothetical protein